MARLIRRVMERNAMLISFHFPMTVEFLFCVVQRTLLMFNLRTPSTYCRKMCEDVRSCFHCDFVSGQTRQLLAGRIVLLWFSESRVTLYFISSKYRST